MCLAGTIKQQTNKKSAADETRFIKKDNLVNKEMLHILNHFVK
jgi:hypothetical protein